VKRVNVLVQVDVADDVTVEQVVDIVNDSLIEGGELIDPTDEDAELLVRPLTRVIVEISALSAWQRGEALAAKIGTLR
jgi:hypothetical protein